MHLMEIFKDKKIQEIIYANSLIDNLKNIPFLTQEELKKLMGLPWRKYSKTMGKILHNYFKNFKSTLGFDTNSHIPKEGVKGVYICLGGDARNLFVAGSLYFNEEDWAANADFYPDTAYDKSSFLWDVAEELEDCGLAQNSIDNLLCILIAFSTIDILKQAKKIKEISNASIVMGYSDGDEVILGNLKNGIFKEYLKVISDYATPSSKIEISAPQLNRGVTYGVIYFGIINPI